MNIEEWDEYKDFIKAIEEKNATISENPVLKSVATYIFNTSGKKLRPLIIMLSAKACSGDHKRAIDASLAVEAIHTASLVHDDILDEGTTRRNMPSVHEKYNVMAAILCGDFLISKSIQWISSYGEKVVWDFGRSGYLLCEGEVMDSMIERGQMSVEQYTECIYKKTAALFEISARIGSRIGAGDNKKVVDAFGLYGKELGMAYQITDDLLEEFDIYEDKESGILSDSLFSIYARTMSKSEAAKKTVKIVEGHLLEAKKALDCVKNSDAKDKLLYLTDYVNTLLDNIRTSDILKA